jgi:NTP pyrophosphatase (non-canonical NTP hydrolase)
MMDVQNMVEDELNRAMQKFPTWPTDPLHALAVLGEEFGELTKAILQHTYEPHKGVTAQDVRMEAIQTAAMAVRLAMSLDRYHYEGSAQHTQEIPQRIMGDDPRWRDDLRF